MRCYELEQIAMKRYQGRRAGAATRDAAIEVEIRLERRETEKEEGQHGLCTITHALCLTSRKNQQKLAGQSQHQQRVK